MQDDPNLNPNQNQNPIPVPTVNPPQGDDSSYSAPISNPSHEAQPFYPEQSKPQEQYIEVSEKEPQIAPEVESAGVYRVSDKIKLDQEARNAGLEEAKESANVVTTPSGKVTLPMSFIEANEKAKGNPKDSSTWIGVLVQLFLKRLGGSAKGEA